jgi:hypothetical protein
MVLSVFSNMFEWSMFHDFYTFVTLIKFVYILVVDALKIMISKFRFILKQELNCFTH